MASEWFRLAAEAAANGDTRRALNLTDQGLILHTEGKIGNELPSISITLDHLAAMTGISTAALCSCITDNEGADPILRERLSTIVSTLEIGQYDPSANFEAVFQRIANLAGVSVGTAHRVIRDTGSTSVDAKMRVQAAMSLIDRQPPQKHLNAKGQATLQDVAMLAGVSMGTASRVLFGGGINTSEKARKNVLGAAKQLGYTLSEQEEN